MEKYKEQKTGVSRIAGGMLLLGIVGFFLILMVFGKVDVLVRESVDQRLWEMAEAVDQTLTVQLERYQEWLQSIIETRDLEEGNGIADVLWMKEGEILSSITQNSYDFPEKKEKNRISPVSPCIGSDGTVYLAFTEQKDQDEECALLLYGTEFFQTLTGTLDGEVQVYFLDPSGLMLVQNRKGIVQIRKVSEMESSDPAFAPWSLMQKFQETGSRESVLYEAHSYSTGECYEADLTAISAEQSDNGYFTIAVSVNYDQEILPLKATVLFFLVMASVLVFGMALLLFLLWKTMKSSQDHLKEISLLKEKNAAMEELNRQTQNLAHHQRLEVMGILTSGIAHEFNNLLTPIMGYSMMILEKLPQDDTELYDEVLEIYQMSSKAKTVISRLSDLSGKNTAAAFQSVSMDELVRRMISAAKSARPNGVDVQLELKCPEAQILGNETQLSQMLLNLILNSYHALEEKGGTLEILTKQEEASLVLTVRDNGYGISKENLEHIFEPFFTTKEAGKGTGLGMAIVAQVVEDHHGTITVESVEWEGTVITVKFPILNKY